MGLFPEPKRFEPKSGAITYHQRTRIVIQQSSYEDAELLAEKLSQTIPCDLEIFMAIVDDEADESRGEVVLARKFFPNKSAMQPAEASERATA